MQKVTQQERIAASLYQTAEELIKQADDLMAMVKREKKPSQAVYVGFKQRRGAK